MCWGIFYGTDWAKSEIYQIDIDENCLSLQRDLSGASAWVKNETYKWDKTEHYLKHSWDLISRLKGVYTEPNTRFTKET